MHNNISYSHTQFSMNIIQDNISIIINIICNYISIIINIIFNNSQLSLISYGISSHPTTHQQQLIQMQYLCNALNTDSKCTWYQIRTLKFISLHDPNHWIDSLLELEHIKIATITICNSSLIPHNRN